jgi:hypothetical protein
VFFPVRQSLGVGRDFGTVELQLHPAEVGFKQLSKITRRTRWLPAPIESSAFRRFNIDNCLRLPR